MKTRKGILCFVIIVAMITAGLSNTVEAATKAKLSKKKVTLTITDSKKNPSVTLKMKGLSKKAAKKVKWSTSKKSVAIVKKGKVTAKKAGQTTITCKAGKKRYTCKVTVVDKRMPANSTALDVTVKDLGEIDITNPETLKRIQLYGRGVKCIVNSQIIVTYNGKNVTNEVEYYIQLSDDVNELDPIGKDGIMDIGSCRSVMAYKNPKLIVIYKREKKTIPLKVTSIYQAYFECYCGEVFNTQDSCDKHALSFEQGEHMKYHGGWYVVPYYVYTIELK